MDVFFGINPLLIISFANIFKIFIRLFGAMLDLCCCACAWKESSVRWLPLLQSTGSTAHRLQELQHAVSVGAAHRLQSTGLVVVHGLRCPIFHNQGSNRCSLHCKVDA